jgi:rare lipoprotein A
MKNLKIILIALVTFFCGIAAQAKITTPAPNLPQYSKGSFILLGKASWYSKQSPGIRKHTANMEVFDDRQLTCAMWGAPFNQVVKVTNRANGKSVVVRVNDRGPHFRYFRKGRLIDLTKTAFKKIASPDNGLIEVEIEFLESESSS